MQHDLALHIAPVGGPEQTMMRIAHRMQRPVDLAPPEIEKMMQHRKLRRKIIFLPDEKLKQVRMIGQMLEQFRRRQAIAGQLQLEGGF